MRLPSLRSSSLHTVVIVALAWGLVSCGGGGGSGTDPAVVTPSVPSTAYNGDILLGAPEINRIRIKLYSATQSGTVRVRYGIQGIAESQTAIYDLAAATPLEIVVDGLAADSVYRYRIAFTATGATTASESDDYRFRTARSSSSNFVFTIQADSHLDENSDLDQYRRTLDNVLADTPDFHIDLGDTFMTEKHSEPLSALVLPASNAAVVNSRYLYERGNFARITHSVPLFLVNGNHDGELGWLDSSTANTLPVWATQARKRYFLNPLPGNFYTGDLQIEPFTGERAAWYAWTWGNALFVALDPFWNSKTSSSKDGWNLTLGERQYRWLQSVLGTSKATHKFVFLHNLVGGLDGQMRGGIEAAGYYEWGGKNADGTDGFAARRPGWEMPIHALLVKNKVTAVFHGHDHFYARQNLDGIVYQLVPQPSARNTANAASLAADYHYGQGTFFSSAGHLRITVNAGVVTSEYVRSWLPSSETASRRNRQVDDRWSVSR